MRKIPMLFALPLAISSVASAIEPPSPEELLKYGELAPNNSYLAHVERLSHEGQEYTLLKFISRIDETMTDVTLDADEAVIKAIPETESDRPVIEESAAEEFNWFIARGFARDGSDKLEVEIGLRVPPIEPLDDNFAGEVFFGATGQKHTFLGGERAASNQVEGFREAMMASRDRYLNERVTAVRTVRSRVFSRLGLDEHNIDIVGNGAEITGSIILELNPKQLSTLVEDLTDVAHVGIPAAVPGQLSEITLARAADEAATMASRQVSAMNE